MFSRDGCCLFLRFGPLRLFSLSFSERPDVNAGAPAGAGQIGGSAASSSCSAASQPTVTLAVADAATGAEIAVANLSRPISFVLAAVGSASPSCRGPSEAPVCRFWDEQAGAFSTEGCTTVLPDRVPPGHTAAELPYAISGASGLTERWRWELRGPVMTSCRCASHLSPSLLHRSTMINEQTTLCVFIIRLLAIVCSAC